MHARKPSPCLDDDVFSSPDDGESQFSLVCFILVVIAKRLVLLLLTPPAIMVVSTPSSNHGEITEFDAGGDETQPTAKGANITVYMVDDSHIRIRASSCLLFFIVSRPDC